MAFADILVLAKPLFKGQDHQATLLCHCGAMTQMQASAAENLL